MQEGAFLDSLQRQAQELDLRGWAQNTEDGRVEVVVEGKPEAVRQVLRWCYSDRSGAEVHATSVHRRRPRAIS
ncbi:MAG: acylphosphatase [Actinomycetota bacterium]|nr:acylphosphatase [Actinomycetota bacterium]